MAGLRRPDADGRLTRYTTDEAGRMLGLSASTVRSAIKRGRLDATKHGRDWLIEDTALRWYELTSLGRKGRPRKSKT